MTRIPFFGVATPAAQKDDSRPHASSHAASPKAVTVDFLSMISQAVRQTKPPQKETPAPEIPATPLPDPTATKTSADDPVTSPALAMLASLVLVDAAPEEKGSPAAAAPGARLPDKAKPKDSVDDSVTGVIMAMLAPPILPAVAVRKSLVARESSLQIAPKQDEPSKGTVATAIESKADKSEPESVKKASSPENAAAKPPPAETAAQIEAKPKMANPPPLLASGDLIPLSTPDGTVDALNKERMKFTAEKKEIAGRATQKVPSVAVSRSPAASAISDLAIDPLSNSANSANSSSPKSQSSDALTVMDWPAKPTEWNVELAKSASVVSPADPTAVQVEKVVQMINQHAMSIRQSGASTMAVSLKVDAHTELFLQLTTHNGQIQASLSYDRGSSAGLDSHWGELRDSLARQNVQLMPREDKIPATTVTAAAASSFDQSSSTFSNSQRRNRALDQELPEAMPVKNISTPAATQTRTVSRQGWESWA